MPVLNLPPQKRDSEVPGQQEAGKWLKADTSLLAIGRGLWVDAERPFSDEDEPIRAVPDPWSQARTFGEALIDVDHTIHKQALGQWRGLLALVALQPSFGKAYELSFRKAHLADPKKSMFSDVLRTLSPAIALGDNAGLWTKPSLLLCNGQPVAMTNPICLVSPGRAVKSVRVAGVPWMAAGPSDPLALTGDDALGVPQLVALSKWLEQLYAHVFAQGGVVAEKIAVLLRAYREQVDAAGGSARLALTVKDSSEGLEPLFDPLMTKVTVAVPDDPASTSRTRLAIAGGYELGQFKGVILVDEAIGRLTGYGRRDTFVWGMLTLGELLANPALLAETREQAAMRGYLLATVDDFLTQRAVKLRARSESHAPVIAGHSPGTSDMLLPVKPLCLLTGGGPLTGRIDCQTTADRATVTLALTIDDGTSDGQPVELVRHYRKDASEGEPLYVAQADWLVEHASLWPDFRSDAWSRYYLRLYYDKKQRDTMVTPQTGLSLRRVAGEIAAQSQGETAVKRLLKLNDGTHPAEADGDFERSVVSEGDGEHDETQFSSTPFDAIAYVDTALGRKTAFAGLVLPSVETKRGEPNPTTVAIDFGTTNTVACINGSNAAPVSFAQRLLFPIRSRNPETHANSLYENRFILTRFLPPDERRSPSATVAYNRLHHDSDVSVGVFKNLIYFHSTRPATENAEYTELEEFAKFASKARFNLKWSDDPAVMAAATDFLDQFMTMVAAEVVASTGSDPRLIRWRFSVPDSMSAKQIRDFRTYLASKSAAISSGVAEPVGELYSEGLAAAVYLLEGANLDAADLNLVLDIGGGTTDVTIFENNELRWRGSFRLAGGDFFTRMLSQNSEILEKIGLKSWAKIFDRSVALPATMKDEDVPHLAELLFSNSDGGTLDLQKAIDKHWLLQLNTRLGEPLRLAGLVFAAGIAWYLGRVVQHLLRDGSIRLEAKAAAPAFALCGRGAGLFKKIHGDGARANDDSDFTQAVRVYHVAAGLDPVAEPQFLSSSAPKLEVVRGMLVKEPTIDPHHKTGAKNAKTYQPAGLGLTLRDGTSIVPSDHIDKLSAASEVDTVDLAEMEAFVAALREKGGIRIDLGPAQGQSPRVRMTQEVIRRFNKALKDARNAGPQGEPAAPEFEPPFITALRSLVAELVAPKSEREARIRAEFV